MAETPLRFTADSAATHQLSAIYGNLTHDLPARRSARGWGGACAGVIRVYPQILGIGHVLVIRRFGARGAGRLRGARTDMDAQKTAVDAVVILTGCDRDMVTHFIRGLYLAGVRDPKRLTFKGLQFAAEAGA
jgi:hypothetical protein